MTISNCLSDLVTRARRYRLSHAEQALLEEHLSICPSCHLHMQIGADFDALGGLRPGDDVLIAYLADRAVERPHQRMASRRPRRSIGIAVAAACALFAAVAGAGVIVQRASPPSVQPSAQAPPLAQRSACEHPGRADCASPQRTAASEKSGEAQEDESVVAIANPTAFVSAVPHVRPSRRSIRSNANAAVVEASAPAETAASLFASANNERRHNHVAAAISLYDELQRRYPSSEEARISHVSLGRLLLDRGIWSEGLAQLDNYLGTSPDGMLAPEALFGKARALETAGRRDDERTAWNRLLLKFPDSVYAPQARHRIEELR